MSKVLTTVPSGAGGDGGIATATGSATNGNPGNPG
jgi:hypothetical protein